MSLTSNATQRGGERRSSRSSGPRKRTTSIESQLLNREKLAEGKGFEHGGEGVEAPTINYGVYQIGEVYARSWSTRVTSGPILMPKRTSSKAVQRGVGISMIRA